MRVLSADWVVPVEGDPIRDGAVAIADDGTIADVGPAADIGTGERFEGCVIVPGLVDCHSHLEYAVYAGFGDGLLFSSWIGMHVSRKSLLDFDEMRAIATDGAHECLRSGITTVGDCSFVGAAAEAAAETGLRAVVYLEVFGRDATALTRFEELRERVGPVLSDRVRLGVSPHAPYTCTLELYEACAALGLPVATHLAESISERLYLLDGSGDWSSFAELLVPPPGTTGIRLLAEAGLLGADRAWRRIASTSTTRRSACSRRAGSASPTALARTASSAAAWPHSRISLRPGSPSASRRTARPRRRRSTCSRSCVRRSSPRGHAPAGLTRCRPRARSSSRPSAARACSAWTRRSARSSPASEADLAVVSLAGSPFDPVEDPATAVVLGGSPDRVAATLVHGEDRYRRGTSAWPDSRRAARRARSRMLQ